VLLGLLAPTVAAAATSAIARQAERLRSLEVEVSRADASFNAASAEYRAATARLSQVRSRIRSNTAKLAEARADYKTAQAVLASRLSSVYRQPQPSGFALLIQSASVSDALGRIDFMERLQTRDGHVVRAVARARERIRATRKELLDDQVAAKRDTEITRTRVAEIRAIRAARQRALIGVRTQLVAMIAAERNAQRLRALQAARQRVAVRISRSGAAPTPTPVAGGAGTPAPAINIPSELAKIAQCESGGNPAAVSGSGTYRGKYQFDTETWKAVGGSGDPAAASEDEQDRRAAILYGQRGAAPWPVCGR
jgi:peptidoglycan hydrolase CwlO-like protein